MTNILDLLARVFISLIFLLSGINKIGNYEGTVGWMESIGMPGNGKPGNGHPGSHGNTLESIRIQLNRNEAEDYLLRHKKTCETIRKK